MRSQAIAHTKREREISSQPIGPAVQMVGHVDNLTIYGFEDGFSISMILQSSLLCIQLRLVVGFLHAGNNQNGVSFLILLKSVKLTCE